MKITKKRKTEDFDTSANVIKKIKSHDQDQGDTQSQECDALAVDRYGPELPESAIYHILLLLPTKLAVRASILSKQWRRVWSFSSLPVLNFDEDLQLFECEYTPDRKKFLQFLHRCLKCRENDEQDLNIFRLRMRYSGGADIINKWLNFAAEKNVKELEIILKRKRGDRSISYCLPWAILNAQFLTTLSLENVRIKYNIGSISLPSVKTMTLKKMNLGYNTDRGFVRLFSGCSSLESLSLILCPLFLCKISSSSLKSLQVIWCSKVVRFKVEATNLESYRFCSGDSSTVHIDGHLDIASCRSLRNLEFFDTNLSGEGFEDDLSLRFPLLESLTLYKCSNWSSDTIQVSNPLLKRLAFCGRNACATNVKINTPNLAFFAFSTGYLPPDQLSAFVSKFSLTAPNLLEANINFNFTERDFSPLRKFLEKCFPRFSTNRTLDCSRKMCLSLNEAEALIFPEETRKTCLPPLPILDHLEVAVDSSMEVSDDVLRDSLQWMAPNLQTQTTMGSYNHSNFQRLLSFTKLLTSHVSQGRHDKALSLFHHMQTSLALSLDPHVFSLALKSCSAVHRPQLGVSVHAHVTKSSILSNPFVASALVDMYGKCVSLSTARNLFDEIPHRNVVVWNAIVSVYTRNGNVFGALRLFDAMDVEPDVSTFNTIISGMSGLDDGSFKAVEFYRKMTVRGWKPDLITLLALLRSFVGVAALRFIKEIHGYDVRNEIDSHSQLGSGLVEAYGRCGCLANARNLFRYMKKKDVVAWSSLISAYALHGEARAALEIFREMELAKVEPDEITFLAVLKACSHAEGLADEALHYFGRMREDYGVQANSDHYSCLVDVLSRAGRLHEAYEVIRKMPVKVTVKAWGALLSACRTYGDLELAEIAGKALSEIEPDNPANYLLLARIYSGLGRHEEAERMRREMKKKGVKASSGTSWVLYQD
ncbi:hypothetical protein ACFX13_046286 [Malus domestica]